MKNNDTLNYLFVKVFNKILSVEEQTLKKCCSNLSVTEIHVIAACADLEKEHANTMSRVAKELSLTTGALSVSVNAIVKKGYLERRYSEKDRRKIYVTPTSEGRKILEHHDAFHSSFISAVAENLSEEEYSLLGNSIEKIISFFEAEK